MDLDRRGQRGALPLDADAPARRFRSSIKPGQARELEIDLSSNQRDVLDGETVLLRYVLAEPHSVLWLVTPDAVTGFELPGRTQIERLTRQVHNELSIHFPDGAAEERNDLAALSRMLFGPVLDRIAGKRLAIAADGALRSIPFAALPVPSRDGSEGVPLIVEHEIVQVPPTAVLRELRRSREGRLRPAGAVALIADPLFETTDVRFQTARAAKSSSARGTVWGDMFRGLRRPRRTRLSSASPGPAARPRRSPTRRRSGESSSRSTSRPAGSSPSGLTCPPTG